MWNEGQSAKEVLGGRGGLDARPSIRQSLEMQKKELEIRLQQINDALDIMTTKPEIAEAFEKLRRVI